MQDRIGRRQQLIQAAATAGPSQDRQLGTDREGLHSPDDGLSESATTRAQFLERRLLWQFKTPVRARVASALRDLICFEEGRRPRNFL